LNYVKDSESYETFVPRVIKAFEETTSNPKHKVIAIVTHGGLIKVIFREFLQLGELKDLVDCAIIEINIEDHVFWVIAMDGAEINF